MEPGDVTGWSALIMGLAALFAGIGALRQPGLWKRMVDEITASPALQFVCGMLELLTGTVVYFANPWIPADVPSCAMKALGGLMMAESLMIIAACDIYSQLWVRSLSHMQRGWAAFTALFGLALTVMGALRLA